MLVSAPTGGSIVNVSSIGSTFGAPGQSIYGTAKAAVVAMTCAASASTDTAGSGSTRSLPERRCPT
ncbi:SDR family NAD(P)-dependent oxidoreductase [Leifsonia sp. NPDC058292]|uniref:SDR family NAD(P)-dependent oxidoreductase n=1 Tax=Leifsonia sp. NPDC058292 TaxID=3346428 RepID=UPI0036DB0A96